MTPSLRLAVHPDRPERLAVIRPDGRAAHWFSRETTIEEAIAKLARAGIAVTVDDDARRPARE